MKRINDAIRKVSEYVDRNVLINEKIIKELTVLVLLDKVGNLNNLTTENKDTVVNSINDLLVQLAYMEDKYEELDTFIKEKKQILVDKLNSKGIVVNNIDTTWEYLINCVSWFDYYDVRDKNVYQFTIPANKSITLQNDLRGDTTPGPYFTDWGDGTIDTLLSHTYTSAGTYIVKTKYSLVSSNGNNYDTGTVSYLTDILDINKNMNTLQYMFANCSNIEFVEADWLTDNITNMSYMFKDCVRLVTVFMDSCNVSNVTNIDNMFDGCDSLYY